MVFGAVLAAMSAHAQSPFGEIVTVEVMSVDVVVLDDQGAAITDLGPGDFEVLVNGKSAPITNFSAFGSSAAPEVPLEPHAPDAPVVAVHREAPPVTWVVYVDVLNTVRNRRKSALSQIEKFLQNGAFRNNDRILVAAFQGDAFKIEQPLTGDLAASGKSFRTLSNWAAPARQWEGPSYPDEEERQARVAINGLRDLMNVVDGMDGRVAMLIVSGGYDFASFAPERAHRLRTVYANVLARLVEGRITAYTFYAGPESLDSLSASGAGSGAAAASLGMLSEVAAFADETGGLTFRGPDARLDRVRTDLDHYYSLGFRPPPHRPGESVDVDVRVRRRGARVRHRDAVRRRTDQEAAQDITMAALVSTGAPPNPWRVQARVTQPRQNRSAGNSVHVDIIVPLSQVLLAEEGDQHVGRLLFYFAVRDATDHFRRLEERALPLAIPSKDLAAARGKSIRYSVELVLPSGSNDLSVTVADSVGEGRSTVRVPVLVRRGG